MHLFSSCITHFPLSVCTGLLNVYYLTLHHHTSFPYHPFRILFHVLHDGTHSTSFNIPWTKTTKELGATVILTAHCDGDPLCPVTAFHNHLNINSALPASSALFAYTSPSGKPKNLLKSEFLKFITGIWSSAMLTHVLGHSFHIGGAVELLLVGVPPEIVAAPGGWTSLAFLLYWRCMDEILPKVEDTRN